MKSIVIGIAGGSGSGKTLLSKKLINSLKGQANYISLDSYYLNLKHLTKEEKDSFNFDHPDSIDTKLLISDLKGLIDGNTITPPIYDFTTSSRVSFGSPMKPHQIIILEGLFLFCINEISDIINLKVFIDVDEKIRIRRRLKRDVEERGRTKLSVMNRMNKFVLPMHNLYIQPHKEFSDLVIDNNDGDLDLEAERIAGILKKKLSTGYTKNIFKIVNA